MTERPNKTAHRIAILSDTHGLLRPEVREVINTCEAILHGGDFSSHEILRELKEYAPVYAVRGNNDKEWAADLDNELSLTLFGVRIYMVHDKQHQKKDLSGTDLFIYGHSHKYEEKTVDGVLFLNPGSCGPRRFRMPVTMAVLEVAQKSGSWQIHKIDLTETIKSQSNKRHCDNEPPMGVTQNNLKSTVETIVRKMRAGNRVEQIAGKLGVDRGFVEQVCRIYVTHPGVDAQGIVDKMEVSALFERK